MPPRRDQHALRGQQPLAPPRERDADGVRVYERRAPLEQVDAGRRQQAGVDGGEALDFGGLREELKRTFKSDVPLKDRDDWESLWRSRRAECDAHTAAIVACEEEINDRVYGLFGLDAGERRIIEEETKYSFGEV